MPEKQKGRNSKKYHIEPSTRLFNIVWEQHCSHRVEGQSYVVMAISSLSWGT
jgi:hypothetical protein